ncbi:MAG: hypothetical protein OEW83_01855 [Acidimicrobiia bacterium]|nr:hypothetical protein [Acidimicrobiia bacterium]
MKTTAVVGIALIACLSSCGAFLTTGGQSEDQWEEISDFTMQPGTMNPAEAEQALNDQVPSDGQILPGSVTHRGSVTTPGGQVDFYSYRANDPEIGTQPVFCTATVANSSMSAGCGDQPPVEPAEPIQVAGESWGGRWRSADVVVQEDVARVEATAVDGTVYTITPINGFGYIEWPDERGSLELIAYDGEDSELGRAFAGLDR